MHILPVGNRILVEISINEASTKSGIVLPDTAEKEKRAYGKITALGTGELVKSSGLKIGDMVMFGKYSGEDVEGWKDGKKIDCKILSLEKQKDESEVLAIVKE